jgi:hypothetical protein
LFAKPYYVHASYFMACLDDGDVVLLSLDRFHAANKYKDAGTLLTLSKVLEDEDSKQRVEKGTSLKRLRLKLSGCQQDSQPENKRVQVVDTPARKAAGNDDLSEQLAWAA